MKAIRIITLFMASAAVAAITSCAKEEASAPEQEQISIIKADIVHPTDESATKTSLGSQDSDSNYPVLWTTSDAIAVSNQSASEYVTYTTTSDGTQSGTFTTSGTAPSDPVYAYYPAGNVISVSGSTYTVTIPAEQNHVESSFGNGAFPMYATATKLEDGLTFQPLMSVLKLQLASSDSKVVKRIIVTSDTEILSGTAQIDMGTGAIMWTGGDKKVELICGSEVTLGSTAKTFHVVVPAADSKNYYVAIVTDDSQTVYLGMVKNLKDKTFTVGKIKKMASVEVTASTAQKSIYVEGSYMGEAITVNDKTWAPVNCGYSTSETYGLLYQWGRMYGQSNYGTITPEGLLMQDAGDATYGDMFGRYNEVDYNWFYGGVDNTFWTENSKGIYDPCPAGWRVPTSAELTALYGTNTSGWTTGVSGQNGFYFNGTGSCSSSTEGNKVFLPAAGGREFYDGSACDRGDRGNYWSSSVSGNYAWSLLFSNGNASMSYGYYYLADGCSVRCVKE